MEHPSIIQGGMGVGVSDWKLARMVSMQGALGVVSGTALDVVMARRLEQGDQDGQMRRALACFPDKSVAERIVSKYYRPQGTPETHDFSSVRMHGVLNDSTTTTQRCGAEDIQLDLEKLTVAANFVEVFLAKEGHTGAVGVNYLEKIQLPNPASIYGAMLAGVDYILMGAGIPLEIPGLLDRYARGESGELKVFFTGAGKEDRLSVKFDPKQVLQSPPQSMKRPFFLAIVSSNILAATVVARSSGRVDGIVVENYTAGGHNAPPRGVLSLDAQGEPIYGPKDTVDYARMVGLNIPFWLGGSCSMPQSLSVSKTEGATGIQVGTLFAFCRESGLLTEIKKKFLQAVEAGKALVFTHPEASPTGFPFKIAALKDTLSEKLDFLTRKRVCNMGYLAEPYRSDDGTIKYRCPAEPEAAFQAKGGEPSRCLNARCLCNALLANIGLGMSYAGSYLEKPLLTVGKHLESLRLLIKKVGTDYSAADVIAFLRSENAKGLES